MDAGGARVQDRVDEARAEDSAELVARILVGVVGQRREQVFGDLDASQVLDAAQAGRVGRGQQARDDRDGDASAARELDEGSVDAASQKSCVIAKEAPAACLTRRRSTSCCGVVPAAGLPAGNAATAIVRGLKAERRASPGWALQRRFQRCE